jgi:hypothetical protein
VVLALTVAEKVQVVVASIAALTALIALTNVIVQLRNERRRTQPIVVAHGHGGRRFAPQSSAAAWVVDAYLTSEGAGPAFNVRFGVEFVGVRYPHRLRQEDHDAGNIQRVLKPGDRRPPEEGSWPILIDSLSMWGRAADSKDEGDLDATRVYWARYENAQGKTWETRNPGDRSTRLDIRRVRLVRLHEWRERRTYEKASKRDVEWDRKVREELLAAMKEGERSAAEDNG